MGSDGVEDLTHHNVATSYIGWVEVWKKSHGPRGIALDGEEWRGRLINTHDGTAKEERK